jgi:isoleucyl-tRNA synthetase
MAREVIRHVQDTRKKAGLEMEDRIELHLETDSETLRHAIAEHKDYIAAETLATKWAAEPLGDDAHPAPASVDGQPLTIELRKVAAS